MAASIASSTASHAATSNTVVGANILSATTLDIAGCASGVANKTHFGAVTPGSTTITSLDCAVRFGSSNDTAQLLMRQTDEHGPAMYSPTRGVLNTSFDGDGSATTTISPGANTDAGYRLVMQPDGKVVVIGACNMGGATDWDVCLARYRTDGTLDPTFDGDGIVTRTGGQATPEPDYGYDVTVLPDGRIVAAGHCSYGTDEDLCITRYNANGSPDTTFDGDGVAWIVADPGFTAVNTMTFQLAIQPDGRMVVAGNWNVGGYDLWLARVTSDGALDPSFSGDGQLTLGVSPTSGLDMSTDVIVQPDGKLVMTGFCDMGAATSYDFCVTRFLSDGTLDPTFDTDGIVTTSIGPGATLDTANAVELQRDGRLVVAGYCDMGAATGNDACLARYLPNGSLDPTFDSDGIVTTPVGTAAGASDQIFALTLEGADQPVVAGQCAMGATGLDVCVLRYRPDGSLDPTFDGDGIVTTAVTAGATNDRAFDVELQQDGKLVTSGRCDMTAAGTALDFCVVSYAANGTVAQYADDGAHDWDTAGSTPDGFGVCLASVSGGATNQWALGATCPATDAGYWNAVPTASTKVAYTTALEPDPPDATANFRFGLRTAANQAPGGYVAPITFDVLAPSS